MVDDFKGFKFVVDWSHCFWPAARQNNGGGGLVNQSSSADGDQEGERQKGARNKFYPSKPWPYLLNQMPSSNSPFMTSSSVMRPATF